jgi:hypothetical protein
MASCAPDLRVEVAARPGQADGFAVDRNGVGEGAVRAKSPAKRGERVAEVRIGLGAVRAQG